MVSLLLFRVFQLEASEKGSGDMSVSLGLVDSDDILLSEWQGSILGPGGVSSLRYTVALLING